MHTPDTHCSLAPQHPAPHEGPAQPAVARHADGASIAASGIAASMSGGRCELWHAPNQVAMTSKRTWTVYSTRRAARTRVAELAAHYIATSTRSVIWPPGPRLNSYTGASAGTMNATRP